MRLVLVVIQEGDSTYLERFRHCSLYYFPLLYLDRYLQQDAGFGEWRERQRIREAVGASK